MFFSTPNSPLLLGGIERYVTIVADGAVFDLDGTLTDSNAAVEAAWTAVAEALKLDPSEVIASTQGKHAFDTLKDLKPELAEDEMDKEVESFEKTILSYADSKPLTKAEFDAVIPSLSLGSSLTNDAPEDCFFMSDISSEVSSRRGSAVSVTYTTYTPASPISPIQWKFTQDYCITNSNSPLIAASEVSSNMEVFRAQMEAAWEAESKAVDRSVRAMPGVRTLVDSIPEGKWAVATSGAKTYCNGCLTRVGISVPKVCITADDPRLVRGETSSGPFALAAESMGIPSSRSVIFDDSPAGIKAAVSTGATVIAVCTSHDRDELENLGADFVVDTLEQIQVTVRNDGKLTFKITV